MNGYRVSNGTYSFSDSGGGTLSAAPSDGTFYQEWANFLLGVADFRQTNIDFRALVHQKQFEVYGQDEWRIRPTLTLSGGVRYSLFLAPTYGNGLLTTFDPSRFNALATPAIDGNGLYVTAPTSPYVNGVLIGGRGSPYGDAVQKTTKTAFAPRIGIAWNPRGDGKTSIRSGFGIFYDSPAVNSMEQFQPGNPPFVSSTFITNTSVNDPASGIANIRYRLFRQRRSAPGWCAGRQPACAGSLSVNRSELSGRLGSAHSETESGPSLPWLCVHRSVQSGVHLELQRTARSGA